MKTPGAGGRAGAGSHETADDTANPTSDKRELQGIASGRHADQHAPRWEDPVEAEALNLLERLWRRP
jgi:hypothetical protein